MIHQIAAAAMLLAQATPAPQRCLTRQEAGDIALTATSIGLNALAEHCRPHVPPSAFLNRGATRMLSQLRAAAEARRQSAFAAFARMAAPATPAEGASAQAESDTDAATSSVGNDVDVDVDVEDAVTSEDSAGSAESMMAGLDFASNPTVMEGFVTLMATAVISNIDAAACPDANDMIESLAPLSPENIARLAGAGLGLAGTSRPNMPDNPLCPE